MLFHYEYFIPEKTEMAGAEICRTKKANAPIFCESPLCLKYFKYSSMAELTLLICAPSESSLAFFTSETIDPMTHHA